MERQKFHLWVSIFCILSLFICGCNNQKNGEKQSSAQEGSAQESKPKQKQIWLSILGGAVGGTFSPFAGGIGTVVSKAEPNIRISVEASAGSIENVRRVDTGADYLGLRLHPMSISAIMGKRCLPRRDKKKISEC